MCTSPLTKDGNTFSCRRCNECVATRRADWVSRAMAERAQHAYTFCYTLTYGGDTQEQRDGAAMFRYADVSALLKRLRSALAYYVKVNRLSADPGLRFICAGEQGDRFGRCHWHMILYSDVDLSLIGEYLAPWGVVTARDQIVSAEGKSLRRRWSHWPHGLVTVQEPDQHGISYAISYALKDQFSSEKSAGTAREMRSEVFSAGMFRMSKRPPIGWTYLEGLLDRLGDQNNILPNTQVPVPDYSFTWYPRGRMRELLLERLRDVNASIVARTGAPAPQWSTLLHHGADSPKDMEILTGVQEEEETSIERDLSVRSREQAHDQWRRETVRRCGGTVACNACLRGLSVSKLSEAGIEPYEDANGGFAFRFQGVETGESLERAQKDAAGGRINRLCGLRATAPYLRTFGQSARD